MSAASSSRSPASPVSWRGRAGAFVTLKIQGALRGCIGNVTVDEPLGLVIPRCAVAACSSDPRFDPVSAAELSRLALEISLLEPLEAIVAITERGGGQARSRRGARLASRPVAAAGGDRVGVGS